jgi:hypothetical protein
VPQLLLEAFSCQKIYQTRGTNKEKQKGEKKTLCFEIRKKRKKCINHSNCVSSIVAFRPKVQTVLSTESPGADA